MGEGAAIPCTEITCCPSTTIWNQEEGENLVGGDGSSDEPEPLPHENDVLLTDSLTKSQLEGMPNSPSQQC